MNNPVSRRLQITLDIRVSNPNLVAIVPAAGLSRRMGQPKLLLPWRGVTVIAHLIAGLQAAGIEKVFVVSRQSDRSLQQEVESAGGVSILPSRDPSDMRTSVECGLRAAFVQAEDSASSQTPFDGWLLIPADHPIVARGTVDALMSAWQANQRQILIPTFQGKRGHPTLFSSDLAAEVGRIPPDCGLNWLVRQHADCTREVPVADPGVTTDLDTPDDYQRLLMDM